MTSLNPPSSLLKRCLLASVWMLPILAAAYPPLDPNHPVIGTLESQLSNNAALATAGAPGVEVGVAWSSCEPQDGVFNAPYIQGVKKQLDSFRAAGKLISLDLGVQWSPAWIFNDPAASFVNQYGQPYVPKPGAAECGVNLVFSQAMRDKYNAYLKYVFSQLGNDFYAIRLGGGKYGELSLPLGKFNGQTNCYWAFDPIAQGHKPGLARHEKPCPVPGWIPGTATPNHASARRFLEWYMKSMQNYHDWQITTMRHYFAGPLLMLYPSIGSQRPGQIEEAINDDCNGSSNPEKNDLIGSGLDVARFIKGITDPKVVVYSTWIDGFPFSDDTVPDQARWSPAHYLASLAAAHKPPLFTGGENTGIPDDLANMQLTFQRVHDYHLCMMYWAFENTLFDGKDNHATVRDFAKCIAGLSSPTSPGSGVAPTAPPHPSPPAHPPPD